MSAKAQLYLQSSDGEDIPVGMFVHLAHLQLLTDSQIVTLLRGQS